MKLDRIKLGKVQRSLLLAAMTGPAAIGKGFTGHTRCNRFRAAYSLRQRGLIEIVVLHDETSAGAWFPTKHVRLTAAGAEIAFAFRRQLSTGKAVRRSYLPARLERLQAIQI